VTGSESWRCPSCHQPLGFVVRRGKRCLLVVIIPGTLEPLAEMRDGTVFCSCGASRRWYPDEAKQNRHTHKIGT